jgi:site-specific DNA recombinase
MNVALYARVSDPKEKRGTIESQIEALEAYAKQNDHNVVESFVCRDRYTGTELARPELDRLRDEAQAGAFEAVLVHDPDRLSRKYAYQILILEEFERLGIPMLFLEQPPPDDPKAVLLVQIQGAVAEYERAKIAERNRRGKLYRARQGEIFWNAIPYGYRRIARRDSTPGHLVIDDAQADIVRKIFAWHADGGMSIRQIALRLTREDHPTPTRHKGKPWGETTVHRILRREAYVGVLYYNTSMWVSVPSPQGGAPRQKRLPRPRSEWIGISIPALIDRELFERSQLRHGPNQQFSPRNLHEEHWLLRRLLRCGRCNRKCACVADKRRPHMPPAYYYRCGRSRPPGYTCHPSHIRATPLDALVWKQVRKHLLNPELLVHAQSKVSESKSLDSSFLGSQIDNAEKRVARVSAERRRLLDAYQSGFLDKSEFEARASAVARRRETLENEIETLRKEHRRACEGHDLLERLQEFGSVLTQRLDSMSFQQRQALVRTVVEEVVICGDTVKLYFKIPLPTRCPPDSSPSGSTGNHNGAGPATEGVSSGFNLRSRSNDTVDVRTKAEVAAPGVKHRGNAQKRAQPPVVGAQLLQGGRGALEKQSVKRPSVVQHKLPELARKREHHVKVVYRQYSLQPAVEPSL